MTQVPRSDRPSLDSFSAEVPVYYLNALRDFASHGSFEGCRVLEIGGSALPRRLVLDGLGARQWVCVDIINHASGAYQQSEHAAHYAEVGILPLNPDASPGPQAYQIFDGSASDIPEGFFGQFDVVFSINAFEHIQPLARAIERAHQSLKPGGLLFSQFGPIWSCDVGSHFWVRPDFCFNAPAPLPPWAHLRYGRDQLSQILTAQGVGSADLHDVLYQVYESNFINRRFYEDYEHLMAASPFAHATVEGLWHRAVPAEIQAELERLHPGRREFSAYGIRIVAKRASEAAGWLELAMPGLAPATDDADAVAQAFAAEAGRWLGAPAFARMTAGLPVAAWPLLPWPRPLLDGARWPGTALPSAWSPLFAAHRHRLEPALPLRAHIEAPASWAWRILAQLYGEPRFATVQLSAQLLWEAWCQHARRLMEWMAEGATVELTFESADCGGSLQPPRWVRELHETLIRLSRCGTAAERSRSAAEALATLPLQSTPDSTLGDGPR